MLWLVFLLQLFEKMFLFLFWMQDPTAVWKGRIQKQVTAFDSWRGNWSNQSIERKMGQTWVDDGKPRVDGKRAGMDQ